MMLPGLLSHRLFGSVGCSRHHRVFNAVVAGVYPKTWVLMAMMTASIMIGTVAVSTLGVALAGTVVWQGRAALRARAGSGAVMIWPPVGHC